MEHCVQKVLMQIAGGPGIKQHIINIGSSIVKGGEQEAQLWRGDDLAGGAVVELVLSRAAMAL